MGERGLTSLWRQTNLLIEDQQKKIVRQHSLSLYFKSLSPLISPTERNNVRYKPEELLALRYKVSTQLQMNTDACC